MNSICRQISEIEHADSQNQNQYSRACVVLMIQHRSSVRTVEVLEWQIGRVAISRLDAISTQPAEFSKPNILEWVTRDTVYTENTSNLHVAAEQMHQTLIEYPCVEYSIHASARHTSLLQAKERNAVGRVCR